jgi:topoisomerase IA-like protein
VAAYEYWTAVFGVNLDGFSDFDHDEVNAIAAEGWEPFSMTAVHGGFAVVVMFRRPAGGAAAARSAPAKKAPVKKALAKKAPAKKAPAAKQAAAAKKAR